VKHSEFSEWSALLAFWKESVDALIESVIQGDASMGVDADFQESDYQALLRSGFYNQSALYSVEDADSE